MTEVSSPLSPPRAAFTPIVLVVGATESVRHVAKLFEKCGYQTTVVASPGDTLVRLAGGGADVVILEMSSRRSAALQAARTIRELERKTGHRITLFALTPDPVDRERCLAAEFDDVLAVPVDPALLDEALRRCAGSAIDEMELVERLGGHRELLPQLRDTLRQNIPSWRTELDAAIRAADADRIRRTAHQMKGALANLAARTAVAMAKVLEDLGGSGRLAAAESVQIRLLAELSHVEAELVRIAG